MENTMSKIKTGMGGSRCGKSRWTTTEDLKSSSKTPRRVESTKVVAAELDALLVSEPSTKLAMRPKTIPEFVKTMNDLFKMHNGNLYMDSTLMRITGRLELDVLKLDDLFHERHGIYEDDGKSMSDITLQEYGSHANAFVDLMIVCNTTNPPTHDTEGN
jgi:hypothetical protein